MRGRFDERIDRACIRLLVGGGDALPSVILANETNRGGRLRDDDGVCVCEKAEEHRYRRQGVLTDHADRPGRVPADAGVFIGRGLDEIGKRTLRILAELRNFIDRQHAGIFVWRGCERLPQRREQIGRSGRNSRSGRSGRLFGFGGRCHVAGGGLRCRLRSRLHLRGLHLRGLHLRGLHLGGLHLDRCDGCDRHRLRRLGLGLRWRGIGTAHRGHSTQDSEPLDRRHAAHRNNSQNLETREIVKNSQPELQLAWKHGQTAVVSTAGEEYTRRGFSNTSVYDCFHRRALCGTSAPVCRRGRP